MPISVHIPIRLRVDAGALELGAAEIEDAAAAAVSTA